VEKSVVETVNSDCKVEIFDTEEEEKKIEEEEVVPVWDGQQVFTSCWVLTRGAAIEYTIADSCHQIFKVRGLEKYPTGFQFAQTMSGKVFFSGGGEDDDPSLFGLTELVKTGSGFPERLNMVHREKCKSAR
jgi:hypothetical protein